MLTTSLDLHFFGLTAPTRRFLRSHMDHSLTRTAYKIQGNIGPIMLFSLPCGEILDIQKVQRFISAQASDISGHCLWFY